MKRMLFIYGVVALLMAACSQDPTMGNKFDNDVTPTEGAFKFLTVDQSRIVTQVADGATAAVTRTESSVPKVEDVIKFDYKSIPDSKKLSNNVSNGNKIAGDNFKIVDSGNYKIDADALLGESNIFIFDNANVYLTNEQNSVKVNIYVLPGATLNVYGELKQNNNIYCWGTLNLLGGNPDYVPDSFTMQGGSSIHIYADMTIDKKFNLQNASQGKTYFESYGAITFDEPFEFVGGDFSFHNDVKFNKTFTYKANNNSTIEINNCAHFSEGIIFESSSTLTMKSNYFVYFAYIQTKQESSLNLELNNSVVVINGDSDSNAQNGRNVLVANTIITGVGNSAVFIPGSITAYMENRNSTNDPNTFNGIDMLKGSLAVLGKKIAGTDNEYEVPTISVRTDSNQKNWYYGKGKEHGDFAPFVESGVAVKNSNISIDAKPNDCRSGYIYNYDGDETDDDDEPGMWITPPTFDGAHKYSATGIDFGEGNKVYVSWHSNLQKDGEDEQPGMDGPHDHGTNGEYEFPSVDNKDDWGGIIDVIEVDNFLLNGALFAQTALNNEHKYNHVKYSGGKLLLPSTSNKVGAALHVVELQNGMISNTTVTDREPDGSMNYEGIDVQHRINLTGYSANCVEVDGNNIWTISGRQAGGINLFTFDILNSSNEEDADSEAAKKNPLNLTEKFLQMTGVDEVVTTKKEVEYKKGKVEETLTWGYKNFGGKYIAITNDKVYALHNTDAAVVSVFSKSGAHESDINLGVALVPYDGKNVMQIDGNNIYVCCGQNGFYVFDMSGNRVGGSMKHANGCDFDDKYIYLATGDGMAVLDKGTLVDATKEIKDETGKVVDLQPVYGADGKPLQVNKTVKYVHYTGKSLRYPGTNKVVGDDGKVKESSNFIKVSGNRVFVAYGMYGLRIYDMTALPEKK